MPWTRLDDQFHTNPKLTGLPDSAFRLYVNGLVWSVANLTDGRIPLVNASQMVSKPHGNSVVNAIRHLVETGLWEPDATESDVWWIHDFDQYQPTKSQVQQEREATRRRVQKHRDRRGNGVTDPLRNGVTGDDVTALVTPPHPNPSLSIPLSPLTHTLTDTLNNQPEDDWMKQPTGYNPHLWAQAVTHTKHQQHAGMTITYPDRYADTIYANLKEQDAIKDTNDRLAAAIAECLNCDNAGWITNTKGDVEIPTTRCTHLHAVEEAEA